MMQLLTLLVTLVIFQDEKEHREWERNKGD